MRTILRALVAVTLLAGTAAAADKPNFTGIWKMNAAKSSFGGGPAPTPSIATISHAEPLLQIEEEQLGPGGVQKTTRKYTTDGTAMSFESQGTQVTSSAVWQDNALIVVSKVAAIGVQFTDRMTLSADGNTLTSAVRIDIRAGRRRRDGGLRSQVVQASIAFSDSTAAMPSLDGNRYRACSIRSHGIGRLLREIGVSRGHTVGNREGANQ